MKRTNKVVFKEYRMNQPQLLPQSVDELIPEKHLVRAVNGLVDQITKLAAPITMQMQ